MDHDILDCAREAENAIRRLARITIDRPSLTPADIDLVIAHLAEAVAALPQAATQLADMLHRAQHDWHLTMDAMSDTRDPSIAIDTARLYLDAIRRPAIEVYRHLDAAHQETAHVCAIDPSEYEAPESMPRSIRAEDRRPPSSDDPSRLGISR
jgi:hypothetical protein